MKTFAKAFAKSMRVLWGCEANWFVKVMAVPVMLALSTLIAIINLLEREK